jgi:threonine aldolase
MPMSVLVSPTTPLDLRSDTVTRPSTAMRQVMALAEVGDDVLDGDPTTVALEAWTAAALGKECALFFPSGSMANQAALWVHTTPGTEVLCDAEAHVYHWEIAGAAALCGVQCRPVRSEAGVFHAADLRAHIRTPSKHAPEPSLVCLENTHNGAGGVVTSVEDMQEIQAVAREHALPVHLDGARLWNAATALQRPLAQLAAGADSVMVSFSKGLGAPVGACLAGTERFIHQAHRARKRFGGGMRQSGILAAAALYAAQHHYDRLAEDHASARYLAQVVNGAGGVRVVAPDTNIVMIDLPLPRAAAVVARAHELGVRVTEWHPARIRAVTHLDAPAGAVAEAAALLRQTFEEVLA